jgi:hypothetical protein
LNLRIKHLAEPPEIPEVTPAPAAMRVAALQQASQQPAQQAPANEPVPTAGA